MSVQCSAEIDKKIPQTFIKIIYYSTCTPYVNCVNRVDVVKDGMSAQHSIYQGMLFLNIKTIITYFNYIHIILN